MLITCPTPTGVRSARGQGEDKISAVFFPIVGFGVSLPWKTMSGWRMTSMKIVILDSL
jgi:hypothetical protein